jgi:hypothetical protein
MATTQQEMEDKYTTYPKAVKEQIDKMEKSFETPPEQRPAPKREVAPPAEPTNLVEEPVPSEEAPPEEMVSKAELEKAEQRNRTLQGMLESQSRQTRFLSDQMQTLQQEVQSLRTPKVEAPKPRISLREKANIKKLKDELQPDVYESIVGAMEDTYQELEDRHQQDLKSLRGEVNETIVKNTEQTFWRSVYSSYPKPKYMGIVNNPLFAEFMGQEEGFSGNTKYDYWMNAHERGDSITFVRYLDAFSKASSEPQTPKRTLGGDGPDQEKLKARLGAPRGAGEGSIAPASNQPGMSPEEAQQKILKLGQELSKGLWEGRDDEYEKEYARLWRLSESPRPG